MLLVTNTYLHKFKEMLLVSFPHFIPQDLDAHVTGVIIRRMPCILARHLRSPRCVRPSQDYAKNPLAHRCLVEPTNFGFAIRIELVLVVLTDFSPQTTKGKVYHGRPVVFIVVSG